MATPIIPSYNWKVMRDAAAAGRITPDSPYWVDAQHERFQYKFKYFLIKGCKHQNLRLYNDIVTDVMCITESPKLDSLEGLNMKIKRLIVSYLKLKSLKGLPTDCGYLQLDNIETDSHSNHEVTILKNVKVVNLWSLCIDNYEFLAKLPKMHTLHMWDLDYKPTNSTLLQLPNLRSLTMTGIPSVSHEILRRMSLSEAVVDDMNIIGQGCCSPIPVTSCLG